MRVHFIVESGTDVRLLEGLAERMDVSVTARAIPGGRAISQPPRRTVRVEEISPSRARFAAIVLQRLVARRDTYDVVLAQGYGAAALAANLAARATGKRTVMLVCSPIERYYECRRSHPEPDRPYRRLALLGIRQLARWNAVLAQRYVVLSQHLADVVRQHGADCPVDVIPVYGVDVDRFAPAAVSKTTIRQRLGLPESGALVFFSSRIAPEKDAETLLAALALLRTSRHDVRLLHLSGGHEALLDAARRHSMADRVIAADAVDPRDDLAEYYRACDVCVQASREEGLGFSPLEALACGVPVVATAVGGLRETIVDGQTGWTYPVGDAAALAGQIRQALDDPEEAARRTAAGRLMVMERFGRTIVWERFARTLTGGA